MSRKKVSTTIYITPEQADRLKVLHERTKVPVSVYIREGIDLMLKHYEHVFPGQMSLEAASPAPPPVIVSASRREVTMGETPPRPTNPPVTLRAGAASAAGDGGSARSSAASPPQEPPPALASKPSRSGESGG